MKPPFSYYGGKQRMAHNIVPLIPKHKLYVEPFCGAGTIMFAKPYPKIKRVSDYNEVLNDSNKDIVNFFKQLRDNGDKLVALCELSPHSESEHRLYKEPCDDELERARRFFVHVNQCFCNKIGGGWARSQNGEAHKWVSRCERLGAFIERMKRVQLSCCDALKCIDYWDSPQTLFYCDPPYIGTNQGHYAGYTEDNFDALVAKLSKIQGSFILSSYDVGQKKPKAWERFDFAAYCSTGSHVGSSRGDRTEVVWRKIARGLPQEIKDLYASGIYDCFSGAK